MRDALRRRRADSVEPLQVAGMPSELQPLLETQNQLFLRIAQTLERERRLTDDAAHELRSPLTAIKTHLQVGLDRGQRAAQFMRGIVGQAPLTLEGLSNAQEQLVLGLQQRL